MSYNDLSDRKNFIQEKKENEDSDDEDVEIKEARRLVEENERKVNTNVESTTWFFKSCDFFFLLLVCQI